MKGFLGRDLGVGLHLFPDRDFRLRGSPHESSPALGCIIVLGMEVSREGQLFCPHLELRP